MALVPERPDTVDDVGATHVAGGGTIRGHSNDALPHDENVRANALHGAVPPRARGGCAHVFLSRPRPRDTKKLLTRKPVNGQKFMQLRTIIKKYN